MRRIVMAASVANWSALTLPMAGSSTPASKLLRILPLMRSRPELASARLVASVCAEWWCARSFATKSVASSAAFTASCLGITRSASANSAMASCSRLPRVVATFSK
eukprot:Mycagemm_TRINITY_DN8947_c0_g2::TRINITY_DN8947_c0_g2_i1::g.5622::m.5622 type:complete len:106 gc:universal TRINITY_DN8947_c0_g2_i1:111-428(+)